MNVVFTWWRLDRPQLITHYPACSQQSLSILLTVTCVFCFVFFFKWSIWIRSIIYNPMVQKEAGASSPVGEQLWPAGSDLHRQHDSRGVGALRNPADRWGRGQDAGQRWPGWHEKWVSPFVWKVATTGLVTSSARFAIKLPVLTILHTFLLSFISQTVKIP